MRKISEIAKRICIELLHYPDEKIQKQIEGVVKKNIIDNIREYKKQWLEYTKKGDHENARYVMGKVFVLSDIFEITEEDLK